MAKKRAKRVSAAQKRKALSRARTKSGKKGGSAKRRTEAQIRRGGAKFSLKADGSEW